MRAFGMLAKMKFLRGGALDLFWYTAESRNSIAHHKETIESLLSTLIVDNLSAAVAIASIPEEIRGYGHVKDPPI